MKKRVLALDTATTACSVALFEDGKLIGHDFREIGRGHAEKLVPMINSLPDKGFCNEILVNCGPGSFTGARIGISAAKALALAWNARLRGYQCLQLIALQMIKVAKPKRPIFVAMLAGHGEYFVQNFDAGANPIDALESLEPMTALAKAQSNIAFGTAANALAALDPENLESKVCLPDASYTYLLKDNQKLETVSPIYIRDPDAVAAQRL